jgi:ABC-2 type transport system permease protein
MNAFYHLFIANIKEFVRDPMALFWTLAFPIVFIILFGFIFSGGGDVSYNIGLVVEDQSPVGEGLAQAFGAVPVFKIFRGDLEGELAAMKRGDRRAVIHIPDGVAQAVVTRATVPLSVYYDPSSQTSSQVVLSIVQQVLDEFDRQVNNTPRTLVLEPKTIQAQRLQNIDYFIPGILAMALMQLGIFTTSIPLISLRERKVLRRLGATPLPRSTLLASHVALRLVIGLIQAVLIVGIGMVAFEVQMVGNWLLLFGFVILGALTFICLGFLVAAFARSEESGAALAQLIQFPMMFLGGLFFPIEIMPSFLRPIVQMIPVAYLGDALRQIMVGALALHALPVDALILLGWLTIFAVLGARFFRWDQG